MSEMPEDIREEALCVARAWYHEEWDPESYIQQCLVDDIASSLLAERMRERERCALKVERMPGLVPLGPGHVRPLTGTDYAQAIRSGE